MIEYKLRKSARKPNKRTFMPKIGHVYNYFTVLDDKLYEGLDSNHNYIKVKCKCGFITYGRLDRLNSNKTKGCFECSHIYKQRDYKQVGNLSCRMFGEIRRNAIVRNLSFEVTMDDLWHLFEFQNKKCALTGIELELLPLFYNKRCKIKKKEQVSRDKITASLDRIDSTKGYTIDNIQWVHKAVNIMKGSLDNSEFINICKFIANHHKNYKDDFEPTQLSGYLRRYTRIKQDKTIERCND